MIVEHIRYRVEPNTANALVAAYQVAAASRQASEHCQPFFQAIKPCVAQIEEMRHCALTPLEWKRAP